VFADIQHAANRDYAVVFPVAGGLILMILALLLRSSVAPWYPMASVGLGFAATLGASVLLFQDLRNEAGLVFLMPIYMYLFVVALEKSLEKSCRVPAHALRRAGSTGQRNEPGGSTRISSID
jgi:uncharacterized membrane protein YdfJ with MMPL/SSD domain